MIVIDASALTKFLLREPGWQDVGEALKEGAFSVDMVIKETCNAVLKRYRRGEMSLEEVDSILMALKTLRGAALKVENEATYIDETVRFALEKGTTVYDALYIVYSKAKNSILLTADSAQAKTASNEGVKVRYVE
ncbi:MAG: type II toxin-antitoxin system VapC family toxin [Nitrososphaerota archaeon]